MNILIFSSFHLPPLFLGLNLEFIQRNIDLGNKVYLIDCNGSFSECGFNPYKLKYMCEICKYRENKGLNFIDGNVNRISIKNIVEESDKEEANNYISNLDKIEKHHIYKDFEVGEAVLSSYISKTRDKIFEQNSDQVILKKLAYNSIISYEGLKRFILKESIEKVFLFNGRWDMYRAAMSAARSNKVDLEIFENYRAGGYSENFGNNLPHNISNQVKLIEEHWDNNSNKKDKTQIAEDFFSRKKNGEDLLDKSYTKNQIKGKLPSGLDQNKKTFVLFNSSEDEFAAVGKEFDNPFFKDQTEGILFLNEYFIKHPEYQLIIRMHPNLTGLIKEYLSPLYALENKHSNILLIKPEDDIDTYQLMDISDTVISFGSTAGLEAAYWGKPVILLGKCFYFFANVCYVPSSVNEIKELIEANLQPLERLNTLKFGYYFATGGSKTKYYHNDSNGDIFFKKHYLNELPEWFKVYYKALKFFKVKN